MTDHMTPEERQRTVRRLEAALDRARAGIKIVVEVDEIATDLAVISDRPAQPEVTE